MTNFKQKVLNYSIKNSPIPKTETYFKSLIDKTESFLKRLRWRTFFFLKKSEEEEEKVEVIDNFGFPTTKNPPLVVELAQFEKDLWTLIDSVEVTDNKTKFQKTLQKDVKEIVKSKKLIVPADKTRNLYEVEYEKYETLLRNNITANYKKAEPNMSENINTEAKTIAIGLKIEDRVEVMAQSNAFITLKDHKPNFEKDTKCRLINPAKTNMGRISAQKLQDINAEIRRKTGLQQWRSTEDTLKWFRNLQGKSELEFVQLDIVDFYPSISKKLLEKAIRFGSEYTYISQEEEKIIYNSRKTLLFDNGEAWVKKDELFDVSMGAYDGAEVAELVGLLILQNIREELPSINFGLYRDDGLGVSKPMPGPRREQARKKLIKLFKNLGLKITIEFGIKRTDYLDVNMDLSNGTYRPYRKPNDLPIYVHKESNHPPSTTRELPKMVNKRLNSISCNEQVFKEASPVYQAALNNSGYTHKLIFDPNNRKSKKKKQRKRTITYFNPPYNAACTINIGREFLRLIDKHFPKNKNRKDKLQKLINRQNVKLSYSGTKSMGAIISNHNSKVLKERRKQKENNNNKKDCNCRAGVQRCPLEGKCQVEAIVYKATITTDDGEIRTYTGSTDQTFKKRHYGHTSDLRNEKYRNNTSMATHIWDKKDKGIEVSSTKWEIMKKCQKYEPGQKKCDVCVSEKLEIMKNRDPKTLNKRTELMATCRHKKRFKLCNVTSK